MKSEEEIEADRLYVEALEFLVFGAPEEDIVLSPFEVLVDLKGLT